MYRTVKKIIDLNVLLLFHQSENLSEENVDKEVVFPEHQTDYQFDVQTIPTNGIQQNWTKAALAFTHIDWVSLVRE